MVVAFASDNKNQWLDQVEEEFGSNLSDHEEDMIGNSGTTIKIGIDAKASLAKEMKGKDYNLEGVDSCLSKRTHHTNMTGKTGMTSTRSVITKKFAMNFSQNKKDLNAERKKTALLEQRIKEMELALAAGIVRIGSKKNTIVSKDSIMVVNDVPHKTFDHPLPPNAKQKSVNISTPPMHCNLAQKNCFTVEPTPHPR